MAPGTTLDLSFDSFVFAAIGVDTNYPEGRFSTASFNVYVNPPSTPPQPGTPSGYTFDLFEGSAGGTPFYSGGGSSTVNQGTYFGTDPWKDFVGHVSLSFLGYTDLA